MSLLGAMRGVINNVAGFGRFRLEVHSGVVDTYSTPDVQIITPLKEYLSKHRGVKALVPFSSLNPSCGKDFDDNATIYCIEKGGETLAYFM